VGERVFMRLMKAEARVERRKRVFIRLMKAEARVESGRSGLHKIDEDPKLGLRVGEAVFMRLMKPRSSG